MVKRKVPVNEKGYRIGEGHHNSTISDAVIKLWRDMHEYHGLSVPEIARRQGAAECTVRKVVYYQRRADIPRDYREVEDGEQEGEVG